MSAIQGSGLEEFRCCTRFIVCVWSTVYVYAGSFSTRGHSLATDVYAFVTIVVVVVGGMGFTGIWFIRPRLFPANVSDKPGVG